MDRKKFNRLNWSDLTTSEILLYNFLKNNPEYLEKSKRHWEKHFRDIGVDVTGVNLDNKGLLFYNGNSKTLPLYELNQSGIKYWISL